jgi:sugar lactone lactonase YvrE
MRTATAAALIIALSWTLGCDRNKNKQPQNNPSTTQPLKMSNAGQNSGTSQQHATLETVAEFNGAMPTGVTVSQDGRIFVNYPRWGDQVTYSVAEMKNGQASAYPDQQINTPNYQDAAKTFISVQSVVVDPKNRLWVLDTGSIQFGTPWEGAAKLVGIDLSSNKVFKTITFSYDVCLPTTYLNDVRFDLKRGKEGLAFITDSASYGANGIIVVDLDSGKSWRKLNDHPSTKAQPNFEPTVEGKPFMERPADGKPKPISMGSDGIAISHDGQWLYYCPLASRHLYRVKIDALADQKMPEDQVAKTVEDLGEKPGASDGLESDDQGRIYATDYEHNAIQRRTTDGKWEMLIQDPKMIWPDTLSLASNGYLYVTANQLDRQARYNNGKDLRQKPYYLFRTKVDAKPVELK